MEFNGQGGEHGIKACMLAKARHFRREVLPRRASGFGLQLSLGAGHRSFGLSRFTGKLIGYLHEGHLADNRACFVCDVNLVIEPWDRLQVPLQKPVRNSLGHLLRGIRVGQVQASMIRVGPAASRVDVKEVPGHVFRGSRSQGKTEAVKASLILPRPVRVDRPA